MKKLGLWEDGSGFDGKSVFHLNSKGQLFHEFIREKQQHAYKIIENMIKFLNKYAKADNPDITDDERDELMKTHFYYIDGLAGYFVPDTIDDLNDDERDIHHLLNQHAEA
jgi:hypothetical protein